MTSANTEADCSLAEHILRKIAVPLIDQISEALEANADADHFGPLIYSLEMVIRMANIAPIGQQAIITTAPLADA